MTTVRIAKNWQEPDIMRQTLFGNGIWNNIKFTLEPIKECDYLIVLNYSNDKIKISCPIDNVWCVMQEPPNEYFKYIHKKNKVYSRVFTQDISLKKPGYILSQPALPWHVNKDYDTLIKEKIPAKAKNLSLIMSSKISFRGHKDRIKFLDKIKGKIEFDLYGYGYNPIDDKWDALAPYKYSLAIENYSGPFYWSEKLADCFLAWTMPIYYGCTNIADYFPKESLIEIDINDPDVIEQIREAVGSNLAKKRKEAIACARELILNKYQLFPYLANEIHHWENMRKERSTQVQTIIIPSENTLIQRLQIASKRFIDSLL